MGTGTRRPLARSSQTHLVDRGTCRRSTYRCSCLIIPKLIWYLLRFWISRYKSPRAGGRWRGSRLNGGILYRKRGRVRRHTLSRFGGREELSKAQRKSVLEDGAIFSALVKVVISCSTSDISFLLYHHSHSRFSQFLILVEHLLCNCSILFEHYLNYIIQSISL